MVAMHYSISLFPLPMIGCILWVYRYSPVHHRGFNDIILLSEKTHGVFQRLICLCNLR